MNRFISAEEFTKLYPVGTEVEYHSRIRGPVTLKTKIRSEAWKLGDDSVIVQVEGKAGAVSVNALTFPGNNG